MIRLCVAFVDGTYVNIELPDHEIEAVEEMISGTPKDLLVRVEVEDRKHTVIYSYKKEVQHVY